MYTRFDLEGRKVAPEMLTDSIATMTAHQSVRAFLPDPLPAGALDAILTAARSSPTSSNLQAYSVIVVTEPERKARLAELSGRQRFIAEAPVFLVFCADQWRLQYVCDRQGYPMVAQYLDAFVIAVVDAALAAQNAVVAAESLGLGTCYVGSIRNDIAAVCNLLGLPQRVMPVTGLSVGYAAPWARPGLKPRLPARVTVHRERYSTEGLEEALLEYDREMVEHGHYSGRQVSLPGTAPVPESEYGWLEHTARRLTQPEVVAPSASLRAQMRTVLERRGFQFD